MLVWTQGAAFEMDWWMEVWFFSRYYNIMHISLHTCMHCITDMVYSKELESDVTTPAMAKRYCT